MVDVGLSVAAKLVIERTGRRSWSGRATVARTRHHRGSTGARAGPVAGDRGRDDEQWRGLRALLGEPAWASSTFVPHAGRRAAHDAIDVELSRWCAEADADALVRLLDSAGIPAAAVRTPEEFAVCVQTRARGFMELEHHPVSGHRRMAGLPLHLRSQSGGWIRTPAPLLGEHSNEVFDQLGLTSDEVSALVRLGMGLTGTRPLGL